MTTFAAAGLMPAIELEGMGWDPQNVFRTNRNIKSG